MRVRDVVKYTLVFLACVVFATHVATKEITGSSVFARSSSGGVDDAAAVKRCGTSGKPPRAYVGTDPQLLAAAEYEDVCSSQFLDYKMIFTNMPANEEESVALANELAVRLKAFASFDIKPIVIIEPETGDGMVGFQEYAKGAYDGRMGAYFAHLKSLGVTDAELGLWVPFPEPQQDVWLNNENPDDFAHSMNRHSAVLRAQFPAAKIGILLDSQVGEIRNAGRLLAYVRLIDKQTVDVVGLQGFPWNPTTDDDPRRPVTRASEFVSARTLDELAKALGAKEVLLNTGTYRHRLMTNGASLTLSQDQRRNALRSIETEVVKLRHQGYDVVVNVFAENKLGAREAVDWSYWQSGRFAESDGGTAMFTDFVHKLKAGGVAVGIYDARP